MLPVLIFITSVGTIVTFSTRASANTEDIEPELGKVGGNAEILSDASASVCSAVQFNDAPRINAHQPFSPTSFWDIPIQDGVTYTTASDIRNEWTRQISGTMNFQSDWDLAIWQATDSSPNVTIVAERDKGYPVWPSAEATHKVPADGVVPGPAGDSSNYLQYYGG